MLSRDSEDKMWSRFVIWHQEVTLARWTQPSGLPEISILQCISTYSDISAIVHFVKSVLKQQQLKTDHSALGSLSLQSFCIKRPVSGFLISVSQWILFFLKLVLKTQFLHLPSQDPKSTHNPNSSGFPCTYDRNGWMSGDKPAPSPPQKTLWQKKQTRTQF